MRRLAISTATPGPADKIASDEQLLARSALPRHHRGRGDGGMLDEQGLDLAGLDAEAADLHLLVEPPEEFDVPLREPAGEVAGAVEPRAGDFREGIGDEALGGEVGAAVVVAAEVRSADQQLARNSLGHGIAAAVQEINLGVGHRPADGRRRPQASSGACGKVSRR